MERNTELFFAVAEQIERHPEHYEQDRWFFYDAADCGSHACVAGWAVALGKFSGDLKATTDWREDEDTPFYGMMAPTAAALLGLGARESFDLFAPDWRPHDGLSVSDALRKIGEGASVQDVSA